MHRLAFAVVLSGVALLAACSPIAQPNNEASATNPSAATPSAAESAAAAIPSVAAQPDATSPTRPAGIARLGLLTDPLPLPLSVAADATDAPKSLAKRVKAGDENALPALLAALQASGIAVVGANDELLLRPNLPWQGLSVKSWEVRLLLANVLPERTVTMSLPQFADVLRAIPELNGPAIDRYLVDDIRALARGTSSPKQFWARFIVELGRDGAAIDENDLLTATDLTQLRLNGLQASLILRRLSLDVLMLSGRAKRSGVPHVMASRAASGSAESLPCTMTDNEQTILEIASFATKAAVDGFKVFDLGFEGLFGYLENLGLASSGTAAAVGKFRDATGIGAALLTYAQFIATYAALEVEVKMEAAPLTRTKQVRPTSGEAKELTAAVRLNTGNAQIFNCFRIMLNALGLDFSLTQDGPVKGARVGWQGDSGFSELVESRGGPDQIVRFVGDVGSRIQSGGLITSSNSITNAGTDKDGKTTVKVEGVGQRTKKSDSAAKVIRHASVHVNVALKGADLFGDLKDAATNATGGAKALISLPVDMLNRSQWASEGHYSFEVIDWSGSQWTGTLNMTRTEVTKRNDGGRITDVTTVDEAKVQVTKTTKYEEIGDASEAEMTGTISGTHQANGTDKKNWSQTSESRICVGQVFSGTDVEQWSEDGSGAGDAKISVSVGASGLDYEIRAGSADDKRISVKGQTQLRQHKFVQAGNGCQNVVVQYPVQTYDIKRDEGMLGIDLKGRADPDELDRLTGSTTETIDNKNGTITTIKITWDLRQD